MTVRRCTICDAVSDPSMSVSKSHYKAQAFHLVQGTNDTLCHECYSDIYQVSEEWAMEESLEDDEQE